MNLVNQLKVSLGAAQQSLLGFETPHPDPEKRAKEAREGVEKATQISIDLQQKLAEGGIPNSEELTAVCAVFTGVLKPVLGQRLRWICRKRSKPIVKLMIRWQLRSLNWIYCFGPTCNRSGQVVDQPAGIHRSKFPIEAGVCQVCTRYIQQIRSSIDWRWYS